MYYTQILFKSLESNMYLKCTVVNRESGTKMHKGVELSSIAMAPDGKIEGAPISNLLC